jgi:hypothetical protein
LGPENWKRFLGGARQRLGLTDEQFAQAQAILDEHREKADAIMIPAWQKRVRENRIMFHAQSQLGGEQVAPWRYQINVEYAEMAKPVQDLGRSFRRQVMALATEEQRQKMMGDLDEVAERHGMEPNEAHAPAEIMFASTQE